MSKSRTGAIIVLAKSSQLKYFSNTGDIMDADISQRLIESIFFKNSPMHDGAIIIVNNKIKAARCVLPVTENVDLPALKKSSQGLNQNMEAAKHNFLLRGYFNKKAREAERKKKEAEERKKELEERKKNEK